MKRDKCKDEGISSRNRSPVCLIFAKQTLRPPSWSEMSMVRDCPSLVRCIAKGFKLLQSVYKGDHLNSRQWRRCDSGEFRVSRRKK